MPARLRRSLIIQALAYRLQEKAIAGAIEEYIMPTGRAPSTTGKLSRIIRAAS